MPLGMPGKGEQKFRGRKLFEDLKSPRAPLKVGRSGEVTERLSLFHYFFVCLFRIATTVLSAVVFFRQRTRRSFPFRRNIPTVAKGIT